MADRTAEFQRNSAFVAFMLVVCFGTFVYLTQSLRATIVPLLWAAFFAVPSTLMISFLDKLITSSVSKLFRMWSTARGRSHLAAPERLEFKALLEQSHILVAGGPSTMAFLQKVNRPCPGHACAIGLSWLHLQSCCRRRVRVANLIAEGSRDGENVPGPEVNRLVDGWRYYIADRDQGADSATSPLASASSEGGMVALELFLDAAEQYPAVLPNTSVSTSVRLKGTLKIDKTSSVSWTAALIATFVLVSLCIWFFVHCIASGVASFTKNLPDYKKGVEELLEIVKPIFPASAWEDLRKKAESFVSDKLPDLASQLASTLESIGFQALMFFIYLFFWIFEPLPVSSPVAQVFKSYLLLKTFVCLLFASLMSVLLIGLRCKIWSLFFVITFLLNYIPEIGAILSAALMVPAIVLDGHLTMGTRLANLVWLVFMGTAFKIFTGNVIEVQMYATQGGQFMRMHPVVIMALIMLFSALLGATGMFLAVPTMAAVKYYLVSVDMPDNILHPLLMVIEGDETGPHKNHVDQQRINHREQELVEEMRSSSLLELGAGAGRQQ